MKTAKMNTDLEKRKSKRIVNNDSHVIYCDIEDDDFTEEKLHSKRKRKPKQIKREASQSSIVNFLQGKSPIGKELGGSETPCSEKTTVHNDEKPKEKKKSTICVGETERTEKSTKIPKKRTEKIKTEEVENRKVRFSNDLQEHSPELYKFKYKEREEEESVIPEIQDVQTPVKNAFTFMMDSRNKVIGQNLPGKELESKPEESGEEKVDLASRKNFLQQWADTKGAKKRQLEYEEKGEIIENKLKKRAKRLKKMLTQEPNTDQSKDIGSVKKRKPLIILSDSDEDENFETCRENLKDSTNKCKSRLTLKKKNSKVLCDAQPNENASMDLDEVINLTSVEISCATPNTTKKWKMRIRVSLSDEESTTQPQDECSDDIKKTPKSCGFDSNKKVASVFSKAKKISAEVREARKNFLYSSIPEKLKNKLDTERVEELEVQLFPAISHVTIKPTEEELNNSCINFWNLPLVDLNFLNFQCPLPDLSLLQIGSVNLSTASDETGLDFTHFQVSNVKSHLRKIKAEHPNYPVYKVFNNFHQMQTNEKQKILEAQKGLEVPKKKRGRKKLVKESTVLPKVHFSQLWTEFYKLQKSDDIFGNRTSVSSIKKWLQKWLESTQGELKERRNSSGSSDFEQDDIEDARPIINNTLILSGPHGSGKTSAVYTICKELGINVLEVNASSKRTGKKLLSELQEATQSHQVRKAEKNGLNAFLNKDVKKKSNSSQSSTSSSSSSQRMCVLLIEDVDVVFDQDENFISSLSELITTSKRPLILTLVDNNCLHLKKILRDHKHVSFKRFEPKVLATWLQVLCLTEGLWTNNRAISELLENNRGDIRQTLLQLQFWVQTGGHVNIFRPVLKSVLDSEEGYDVAIDESSNLSWASDTTMDVSMEDLAKENDTIFNNNNFLELPLNLDKIWWNLPGILGIPSMTTTKPSEKGVKQKSDSKTELEKLKSITNTLEALALTDYWYSKSKIDCDINLTFESKYGQVKDGLNLNESYLTYSAGKDLCHEVSHFLLQEHFQLLNNSDSVLRNSISNIKSYFQKQTKSMKPFHEITPLDYTLHRKAITVDYFPLLRQISRTESFRSCSNIKRNNRFYHYLRNLGMSYNSNNLQIACKVLNCEEL